MTPPRVIPPQMTPQAKVGLWRRTPPAIFPPLMGLFGLGLAWRRATGAFDLPGELASGVADMILGAVTLLWLFAVLAYVTKVIRRPAVVTEDLRILPGRAGLSSMVLSVFLLSAVMVPHAAGVARVLLFTGLALQTGLALLIIRTLIASAPEGRSVTPIWHLSFVGFIIAGVSAAPLGFPMLGQVVLFGTIPVAVAIWGISLVQLIRRVPPAPLRPLLAIHLAPASLFGTVSAIEGYPQMAMAFAVIGGGILGALLLTARWITVSGFGPLWGAFTFPTAAYAGLLLLLGGHWAEVGGLVLVVATLTIPVIAFKVFQLWANGQLAVKTNAAVA